MNEPQTWRAGGAYANRVILAALSRRRGGYGGHGGHEGYGGHGGHGR